MRLYFQRGRASRATTSVKENALREEPLLGEMANPKRGNLLQWDSSATDGRNPKGGYPLQN